MAKITKIGFTGTRRGMSGSQMQAVLEWLLDHKAVSYVVHGACEGADRQFHTLVRLVLGDEVFVQLYPAVGCHSDIPFDTSSWRHVHDKLPPLQRNIRIVNSADVLLACPAQRHEVRRSGTWATIRYARKAARPVIIFEP